MIPEKNVHERIPLKPESQPLDLQEGSLSSFALEPGVLGLQDIDTGESFQHRLEMTLQDQQVTSISDSCLLLG